MLQNTVGRFRARILVLSAVVVLGLLPGLATAALQWQKLGGPEGGNINDIVQAASTLYVANAASGVFKSTDGGATWTDPGNAGLPTRSVIAVAVAPDGSVLAGTDLSVYRSTDGGANWVRSDSGMDLSTNGSDFVSRLIRIGTRVWAFGGDDLFVSTNNGQTWTSSHTGVTGFFNLYTQLSADPAGNLYLRTADQGLNPRLYVSSDNGANWTQRSGGGLPAASLSAGYSAVFAHPSNGKVFLGFGSLFGGADDGIYESSDQGVTWTRTFTGSVGPVSNAKALLDPAGSRVLFINTVALNGDLRLYEFGSNSTRTLAASQVYSDAAVLEAPRSGLFLADGSLLLGTATEGVYRSDTGVTTFSPQRSGMLGGRSDTIAGRVTGGATELVLTRSTNIAFDLAGLGNARTTDGGVTWSQAGPRNGANKEVASNTVFATRAGTYLAVVGANAFTPGTLQRSTDGGQTWTVVPNSGFGNSLFYAGYSGPAWAQDSQGRIFGMTGGSNEFTSLRRSVDDGLTFTGVGPPQTSAFYALAIGPDDALYVVSTAGSGFVLSRSTDGGATWNTLANSSTHTGRLVRASDNSDCSGSIGSVAVTSDGAIFAFACQRVFRSVDGGASFTDQSNGLTRTIGSFVLGNVGLSASIQAMPGNFLVLDSDGSDLYTSTDCGATWVADGAGLPELGRFDPDVVDNVSSARGLNKAFSPGDGCIYGAPIDHHTAGGARGTGVLHKARLPAQGMSCGGPLGGPAPTVTATGSCGSGGPVTDTDPDPIVFTAQNGVAQSTVVTSNTVTISGIDTPSPISVSGGEYSIGCAANAFTTAPTNISAGQTVCVRHTSAPTANTSRSTTLTVGTVSGTFTSTTAQPPPPDTTPNAFAFSDQINVPLSSTVTSNAITVGGINAPAAISVANGSYSIGCGTSFVTAAGTIANGQTVCVRHTSAATNNASTTTTLTIGGVSGSLLSTTVAAPAPVTGPNAFSFQDQSNACFFRDAVSPPITVSGLSGAASLTITGGEYSINNGPFSAQPATVSNGAVILVTHVTATTPNTARNTTLTINNVSDTFTSTTGATANACDNNPPPGGNTVIDAQGRTVTFATSAGTLTNLRRVAGPNTAPSGFAYPNGFFAFEVTGLANGASATVTITLPAGQTADEVVKCIGLNCGVFPATINGNVIRVTLTDGGAGDADGADNGRIVDPIAPAVAVSPVTLTTSGGSLGGGLLALLGGLLALRRRASGTRV